MGCSASKEESGKPRDCFDSVRTDDQVVLKGIDAHKLYCSICMPNVRV